MTRKWGEHPTDGMGLLRVSKMLKDEQSAPLSSNEWGGVEKLAQQRNDALAEVERLTRERDEALAQVIAWRHNAQALAERSAPETTPFPYPTDRDGWICSVCHGWNVPKDRVCMHSHLPAEEPKAEQPEPCRGCGWTIGHALDCPYRFENAMTILRAPEKASRTRLVEQRNGFKDGSTVPEQPEAPTSDKCEHGIPRQFCTAMHAEKTEASLPPCECLLIAKEPSAYHALKCPRFVADKL